MEYKKLLIYSPTKEIFEANLANGVVDKDSVGFINEPREIWAQGIYYPCAYSKEELDNIIDDIYSKINSNKEALEEFIRVIKGNVSNDYNSLEKLEGKIKEEVKNREDAIKDVTNKLSGTTIVKVSASNKNTAASYELHDSTGNKKGVTIDIPKDQSIKDIKVSTLDATLSADGMIVDGTGTTALCISYILADGTYKIAHLDYQKFLEETEFSDGTQIVNHQVKVKIDNSSESFLTVSSNGVKLSGVQNAITTAINNLDVATIGNANTIVTSVTETNGKISATTVSKNATNISSTAVSASTTSVAIPGTNVQTNINNIGVAIKTEETSRKEDVENLWESIYYHHATTTIKSDKTLVEKGVNTSITLTATSSFKGAGANSLDIKNSTSNTVLTSTGTTSSKTATATIADTTTFQAVAKFDHGITKTSNVTVTAKYPIFTFGSKNSTATSAEILTGTKSVKSSANGNYNISLSQNLMYFWICVPSEMTVNKVTLSGFDVPMETATTVAVTGKGNYKCYRSSNTNDLGSYTLVIS